MGTRIGELSLVREAPGLEQHCGPMNEVAPSWKLLGLVLRAKGRRSYVQSLNAPFVIVAVDKIFSFIYLPAMINSGLR